MGRMNVLMMGVLAAATVVADDGRDYRICGLDDDGRLTLVESRKREVRPVVALPVEEAPLATAVFKPGEKLDEFDCEALEHHIGAVRIDAGEGGAASEVYLNGLKLKDFLARERKFRPPVARNGFGRWEDAERLAAFISTNGANRTYSQVVDALRRIVDGEMVRPVSESADGKKAVFRKYMEDGITNRVLKALGGEATPGECAISLQEFKYGVMSSIGGFGKSASGIVKLMQIFSQVKVKPELNADVNRRMAELQAELETRPGSEFVLMLLANAQIVSHKRSFGDRAVHPQDATNFSRRVAALATRYADSPALTRALYENIRPFVSRPADADSPTYGYSLADRRDLVAALRDSKADPWLADVCEGMLELDLAWYGKDDMYAYCPRPDWPRRVHPHLLSAREAFFRAWKRHPQLPEGAFGMLATEWELYHSKNAAHWLGWLLDAEIDTPWVYDLVRHRMLSYFAAERKSYDTVHKAIAALTKRDRIAEDAAALEFTRQLVRQQKRRVFFPVTNEWRNASFASDDAKPGETPFRDVGKVQNMQFDPNRRDAVWPVMWRDFPLPTAHEGEAEVEIVPTAGVTNRIALGFMVDNTTMGVFSQVSWRDGAWMCCSFYSPLGPDARCYPWVLGEKDRPCPVPPAGSRFRLRYRIKDRLLCVWIDGKPVRGIWFVKGIPSAPECYRPAFFGTGVKIHSIRYRRVPPNAGLEEFVR